MGTILRINFYKKMDMVSHDFKPDEFSATFLYDRLKNFSQSNINSIF